MRDDPCVSCLPFLDKRLSVTSPSWRVEAVEPNGSDNCSSYTIFQAPSARASDQVCGSGDDADDRPGFRSRSSQDFQKKTAGKEIRRCANALFDGKPSGVAAPWRREELSALVRAHTARTGEPLLRLGTAKPAGIWSRSWQCPGGTGHCSRTPFPGVVFYGARCHSRRRDL